MGIKLTLSMARVHDDSKVQVLPCSLTVPGLFMSCLYQLSSYPHHLIVRYCLPVNRVAQVAAPSHSFCSYASTPPNQSIAMRARALRPLLPLAILPLTLAQSISFSVKGSSCVIIGQISASSSPNTLERSTPLCPGETRDISWPLSNSGEGENSHFGLYANFQDGRPGCVVGLGPDQVGYLVGRQLEWREQEGLLFDVAANGEVLNTNTWEPIMW